MSTYVNTEILSTLVDTHAVSTSDDTASRSDKADENCQLRNPIAPA